MPDYRCLSKQVWTTGDHSIVPIRFDDRHKIREWRNEQIYHLRQKEPLTKEEQDRYFEKVVAQLFEQEQPGQILFSFLKEGKCVGYGGLVHINWIDKNAEISFLMNTEMEHEYFEKYWRTFIDLIEQVAFQDLSLHKIFTYAFDVRHQLYDALEKSGYTKEAVLKEHCFIDDHYRDAVYHSKFRDEIHLRKAVEGDVQLTYQWASNDEIRKYAMNTNNIDFKEHSKWFMSKLSSDSTYLFIAEYGRSTVGSFRIDVEDGVGVISYLLDPDFHGKGLGNQLLQKGIAQISTISKVKKAVGFVKEQNIASKRIFVKNNFALVETVNGLMKFELKL